MAIPDLTGNPLAADADARAYLQPLTRRKWLILAMVLIVTTATYAYYRNEPKRYRASSSIYVKTSELSTALEGTPVYTDDTRNTANQAELLQTPAVARNVARRIKYDGDPLALLGSMKATAQSERDFIDISATGRSGAEAAAIANGFADAFIQMRGADQRGRVSRALKAAEKELAGTPRNRINETTRASLESTIRQLNAAQSLPTGTAERVRDAVPPGAPFEPNPTRSAIFGFFVALALAIAAAFGLERLDRRIKNVGDVESIFRAPLLSLIPRDTQVAPIEDGMPTISRLLREPFRTLRVNVNLAAIDRDLNVLAVVSAVPDEGKSTVIRNLALAYAEAGLRVAVVESDLRKPRLATTLNVQPRPGITDVLAGTATLDQALKTVELPAPTEQLAPVGAEGPSAGDPASLDMSLPTTPGSVTLLPSGPEPPNPPVLGASEPFQAMVNDLKLQHDIVLLDTAPLLIVSDAVPLVEIADGTVIVTRFGETTRDAARRVVTALDRIPHARVLGVVANQVPPREVGSAYTYYSYNVAK